MSETYNTVTNADGSTTVTFSNGLQFTKRSNNLNTTYSTPIVNTESAKDVVTGVKGENETEYRTGDVSISKADLGIVDNIGTLQWKSIKGGRQYVYD